MNFRRCAITCTGVSINSTSLAAQRHAIYLIGLFRDITAIPLLIDIISQKDKALLDVTEDALAEITKQRLGAHPRRWNQWWAKNQGLSRIAWLIEGLASKDELLRRSADDELRAVTGLDMGYDDTAPKRERDEARQRWVKWWQEQNPA